MEIRGLSWCDVRIGQAGGFSLPPGDLAYFYISLTGSARIAGVAGGRIDLREGEIAIVISGEAHSVRNDASSPCVIIDFFRDGSYGDTVKEVSIDDGPMTTRLLCGRLKVLWPSGVVRKSLPAVIRLGREQALVDARLLEVAASGTGSAILLTRLSAFLFALAVRSDPDLESLFLVSPNNNPIARALQHIDRQPDHNWTVGSLARYVGMGRSSFAARFLADMGRTPMEAVTEHRMQVAADLLASSDLKVAEIATRVGYQSEAAFTRRFSRFFGLAPGRARNMSARPSEAGKDGSAGVQPPDAPFGSNEWPDRVEKGSISQNCRTRKGGISMDGRQ